MGQIAGYKVAAPFALAEVDVDGVLAGGAGFVGVGLVEERRADAVGEYRKAADLDGDRGGIEGDSGASGGGEQAAPVGVGRGPGGFAERRVGDGAGDGLGVGVGLCAGDFEGDDVGDAFAVVDDGVGE